MRAEPFLSTLLPSFLPHQQERKKSRKQNKNKDTGLGGA